MDKKVDYKFELMFNSEHIKKYSSEYSYEISEHEIIKNALKIKNRGYLTKAELQTVANWKTPRSKTRIALNTDDFVREITAVAFSTQNERLKIEILTLLDGVSWPTASVLLHFYSQDKYPIIDFRVLFSLKCSHIKPQHYNFKFWSDFTEFTREISDNVNVNMRTLDRALWQFSKEYQSRL